ncbi:MAG: hypothetical protein KDD32_03580 [Bacteroidetes bacterium]|nr:hypothetical protein [Bacteroidota bacterium]
MKTVKIIDNLYINENGVQSKLRNGKFQNVHFQQGTLDGACAVYSCLMILILIKAAKYSDISSDSENNDKRFSIERLKKELLDLKGMHRNGNHFYHKKEDNLKEMLERSFSKLVRVEHVDHDVVNRIRTEIEQNTPVLMSFSFSGGAHALVGIGVEYDDNGKSTKILCLDPAYPSPKFTYWNSVVDLETYRGKYKHRNFTESGISQSVRLEDILVITKK